MEIVKHDIKLKDMSNEEIRLWGKTLAKDNVILLKNQDCSKKDLVRIYDSIGRVAKPVDRKTGKKEFFADDDYPQLMRVTNERKDGEKIGIFADKELGWHSNGNARDQGKECSVALYCVKEGTDSITSFADMRQAYRDLPNDIKNEVDNIECLYKFKNGTFYDLDNDDKELEMFENRSYYINGVKRRLVYQHPYDNDFGLYYTFHYIQEVYGNITEWDKLDKYLMEHCFQDKYIAHHSWEPGDLIFMDQFHSLHKRNEVKGERLLYRSSMDYRHVYK
jgi:alpha-ketoglutarate-dependent 2,4-dichlorophenoxyacetate dioxygenase